MNRTARKFARDLLVTNTIGQIIVAVLEFLPEIGEVYNLEPGVVAAISTSLSLSLAIYRIIRENFTKLAEIDDIR